MKKISRKQEIADAVFYGIMDGEIGDVDDIVEQEKEIWEDQIVEGYVHNLPYKELLSLYKELKSRM